MGKPNMEGEGRQVPPQIVDVGLTSFEADEVVVLLEEMEELDRRLDDKIDDASYDPKFHLARRYLELKEKLAEIQAAEGQEDGLRWNRIWFRCRMVEGRRTLDKSLLTKNLLAAGVKAEVLMQALNDSTKTGEQYWVKEIKTLTEE